MGNRAPQRGSLPSSKQGPNTSSQESVLVNAQRQSDMKQRRKALNSSKGIRMNMSTNSLPDLNGYFEDATSNASGDAMGLPIDTDQLKEMLQSMGVQFSSDSTGSERTRELINSESVIKVFATMQEPDWTLPWQTLDVSDARGSGVVIEGGYVLTAAHVIAQWTFIEIQKSTDPKKVPTKVVYVCHDADLALLAPISNTDFLKDIKPVKIGDMPKRHDRVFVSGFPIGGEELSVTEGVVSRIEIQPYSHSLRQLLAVTVDAAINSGNSGGPVFDAKGELAGIAFQALEGAEAIGHIIPPPIINHFLQGSSRDGKNYQGFPELGVATQNLENPALRKHLKMKDEHTGVLVVKVWYGCSGYEVLCENDVILEIDGFDVSNTGTIEFDDGVRGELSLAIHKHFCGDRIPIKILRDGQVVEVNVELKRLKDLSPLSQYIHSPPFYLFAGLLFQPLSTDLLRNYFSGAMMIEAPQELLYLATSPASKTRTEVVVLTRVFRDDINIGYEDLAFSVITHVCGQEISSLKHFVECIEGVKDDQLIKLGTASNATIILPHKDTEEMKAAAHRIMKRYNVTQDRHIPDQETHKKKKHRKSLETAQAPK